MVLLQPCTCPFVVTGQRFYWMVWIFILRLSTRPFLGLVGEVASPPISTLLCPERLVSAHLWDFFLKGVLSKTLAFWKNLKVSALFLGVPIWIFVSKVCGGKSKVVDKLDVNFRTSWGFSFNQHYWRYPLLLQVCWSNPTSRLAEFLQSFCPLFTCVTGDLEF